MRSAHTTVIIALLLVVAPFAPTTLASYHESTGDDQGQADGNQTRDTNQTDGPDGNQTGDGDGGPPEDAQERRQQARQRAAEAGLFGTFSYQDGQAEGRFVSFGLDESTGTVTDFTLARDGANVTVFDEVAPGDFTQRNPARVTGSVLQLAGEEVRFQGFDNPSGLLKYQAQRDVQVTFDLAENVTAEAQGNSSRVLALDGPGDLTGTLVAAGNGTAEAGNGSATLDLERGGVLLFRADPADASPEEKELNRGLDQAASEGKLGASARIAGVNGTPAQQSNNLSVNASAQEATDGRVRVEVDGDQPDGKVVHLSIARENLNVSTPDEAAVKFDGQRVPLVDSVDEVVNASADDEAKAHVVLANGTAEVAVWVPEFSLHTITTKDTTQDLADLPTPPSSPNPTGATASFAGQAKGAAQDEAQRLKGVPMGVRNQANSRAVEAGLFGTANLSGGSLDGAFVSASVSGSDGAVSDLSVEAGDGEVKVLSDVVVQDFSTTGEAIAAGPTVTVGGANSALVVQDIPSAALQARAGDEAVRVNFTVPSEADVSKVEPGHLEITVEGLDAHLLLTNGEGELVVNGDTVTANLGANAGALFTVHPPEDVAEAPNFDQRLEAIKSGTLGAEAQLAAAGEDAVGGSTGVSVDARPAGAGDASVSATVSSEVPDARAVTISVPKEDLDVDAASEVEVTVDGQPASEAASVDEVLGGTASGDAYAAADAGDVVQVAVQVSGFSDHTVTTSGDSTDDGVGGDGTPLGGGLALVAVAGGALALSGLRRRR